MKKSTYRVDKGKSSLLICKVCWSIITKEEIRIGKNNYYTAIDYYHMNCFTPKLNQFIRKKDLEIKLNEEDTSIFLKWLEDWNAKQFSLKTPSSLKITISKQIKSSDPLYKRSLLEIFKYLDIEDILKNICLISKEYYHLTWNQELWHYYCVRDYHEKIQTNDWKQSFINDYFIRCIECKQKPKENDPYICPFLKKVICDNCKKLEEYKSYSKSKIKKRFDIDPKLIDIKYIQGYEYTKIVHYKSLKEAILRFRKKNKDFLLEKLKTEYENDHEIIQITEDIDINQMEIKESCSYIPKYNKRMKLESYKIIFDAIRSGCYNSFLLRKLFKSIKNDFKV